MDPGDWPVPSLDRKITALSLWRGGALRLGVS